MSTLWEDDDSEWQDMPVLRSQDQAAKDAVKTGWRAYDEDPDRIEPEGSTSGSYTNTTDQPEDDDDDGDPRLDDLDARRRRRIKQHKTGKTAARLPAPPPYASTATRPGHARLTEIAELNGDSASSPTRVASNATGNLIDLGEAGSDWREKGGVDEQDYTRLLLDDDPDEDEVHTKTQYLFDDDKGMTPLAQMQTTKNMLTEAQRIAYVGLCRIVTKDMAHKLGTLRELQNARESTVDWATRIMGRLYQHMELEPAEQRMIEQLAEHGVTALDLVPSLIATHIVANPEYDPEVAEELKQEQAALAATAAAAEKPPSQPASALPEMSIRSPRRTSSEKEPPDRLSSSLGGDSDEAGDMGVDATVDAHKALTDKTPPTSPSRSQPAKVQIQPESDDDMDIASALETPATVTPKARPAISIPDPMVDTPKTELSYDSRNEQQAIRTPRTAVSAASENLVNPLPHTLPGVSQTLTAADKTVTLDIRWTVLCDLFLAVIADSVYDARSRVLLGQIAQQLGLTLMDVVRFERRLIEALELQEGVAKRENQDVIDLRAKQEKRSRYIKMGLATLGGGLVIGLSAGLLAPVIGAGLGAALATFGASGASAFLGGTAGAAIITSGGVITGSTIGVKGMARRTRHVSTFDFIPVHNNKRLNVLITVPGYMNGPLDDVRLPFSVIDPVEGDVFSVLWEPKTLGQTGAALGILTREVLSTVGQQALQATLLSAMMSALQWPILLTKLGYLIDNPWNNALDRAYQAGNVLAQILINRSLGVRPVSLAGFSLGARVIFYALAALAKAKAFGIVQDVFLMGATVSASRKIWQEVSGVVGGRFVNAYARNDWLLGYLFRATAGGLNTVAGLRPVEYIPRLENIDITDILAGHTSYRSLMPIILAELGFKTTADSFDEPEDPTARPDREVVNPEMEQARLEQQKKAGWLLSRFKKDNKGRVSPNMSRRGSAASNTSTKSEKAADNAAYDEDVDVIPTTVVPDGHAEPDKPDLHIVDLDTGQRIELQQSPPPAVRQTPALPAKTVPEVGNFDLSKIREEIAKDDGSGQLLPPSSAAASRSSTDVTLSKSSGIRSLLSGQDNRSRPSTLAEAQRAQEELEKAEAEFERRQQAFQRGHSLDGIESLPDVPSLSLNSHPYPADTFSNPFASSSASLAFGGNDGSITASNGADSTPWTSSDTTNGFQRKLDDPWNSGNEWASSNPRW